MSLKRDDVGTLVNPGSIGGITPGATRKYMGEYFGREQMGIAKAFFYKMLLLQTGIAAVITLAGLAAFWFWSDRQYRVISLLMIASILPYIVNSIAAGANRGLEDLRANVPPSLAATGTYVIAVFLSLYMGWDLLGIAVDGPLWWFRTASAPARSREEMGPVQV